ncbi:MAG: hypothetical protein AAFQ94_11965 [Bacteroidota bacterium]
MSTVNKYKLWIGPYLRDELTDAQKSEFEMVLDSNEELKKEFSLQKDVIDTINKKTEFDDFKDALNQAQNSFFDKHKKKIAEIFLLSWIFAA